MILPDVRGLHRFYEQLALRFAENGYDSIAIDYFGRTAGIGKRPDAFPYADHVPMTTIEGVTADTAAAIAELRSADPRPPHLHRRVLLRREQLLASGRCRARPLRSDRLLWQPQAPACRPDRAGRRFRVPRARPDGRAMAPEWVEVVDEFRAALDGAGKENEIIVYPGAPHSFFDRKQEEFVDASADAWRRVLDFIGSR